MSIEEKKKQRFQFIHKLYELTAGNEMKWLNMREIGTQLGFDEELTFNIAQYLKGESLLEFRALGGSIGITHWGVKEVEEALSNPDKPTTHFLPVNVISIGQMVNSQIQQASPEATQVINFNESKIEELREIIKSLQESIDQFGLELRKKSDLQAEIQTIEAQLSSSKPKAGILVESLRSMRTILEGLAGSALATALLPRIIALLGGS